MNNPNPTRWGSCITCGRIRRLTKHGTVGKHNVVTFNPKALIAPRVNKGHCSGSYNDPAEKYPHDPRSRKNEAY